MKILSLFACGLPGFATSLIAQSMNPSPVRMMGVRSSG